MRGQWQLTKMGLFDSEINVRIGQNNVRTLAAQFERHALQVTQAGRLLNQFADLGGAGEGHFVDVHVAADQCTGASVAGHHIDYALWEASFFGQLGDVEGRQAGLLGRFQNDCVSSCEGRSQFPGYNISTIKFQNFI